MEAAIGVWMDGKLFNMAHEHLLSTLFFLIDKCKAFDLGGEEEYVISIFTSF